MCALGQMLPLELHPYGHDDLNAVPRFLDPPEISLSPLLKLCVSIKRRNTRGVLLRSLDPDAFNLMRYHLLLNLISLLCERFLTPCLKCSRNFMSAMKTLAVPSMTKIPKHALNTLTTLGMLKLRVIDGSISSTKPIWTYTAKMLRQLRNSNKLS